MTEPVWRVVISEETDPAWNLAVDEAILRGIVSGDSPNTIRVWRSRESVIVGRCQDIRAEVDYLLCKEMGVPVLRRCSGGGAVYMDLGNYNYSVLACDKAMNGMDTVHHVSRFICSAIVGLLSRLGCQSRFVYPSSVFVESQKISGSAQFMLYEGFLHHGTLLVSADLEMMQAVLNPDPALAKSLRAVPSTPSPVVNLSALLKRELHPMEITHLLVESIMSLFERDSWTSGSINKSEDDMTQLLLEIKYSDSHWLQGTDV